MNKYHAKKTVIDGITFDSKAEANHYCQLKLLSRTNEVNNLELQPKYLLQDAYKRNGKAVRALYYIADFRYIDKTGKTVVVDVKGMRTKEYLIKRKLLLNKYPDIRFIEISGRNAAEY